MNYVLNYLVCGDLGKGSVTMVTLAQLDGLLSFHQLDINCRHLGIVNLDCRIASIRLVYEDFFLLVG